MRFEASSGGMVSGRGSGAGEDTEEEELVEEELTLEVEEEDVVSSGIGMVSVGISTSSPEGRAATVAVFFVASIAEPSAPFTVL